LAQTAHDIPELGIGVIVAIAVAILVVMGWPSVVVVVVPVPVMMMVFRPVGGFWRTTGRRLLGQAALSLSR